MDWVRTSEFNSWVILKSKVNVLQRWWHLHSLVDAETHAHGLIIVNVGILPQDDNLDIAESRLLVRIEDLVPWREARVVWQVVFFLNEAEKLPKLVA